MARTKVQPAHKSTDGEAPHIPIGESVKNPRPRKAAPKKRVARTGEKSSPIEWFCPSVPYVADQSLCSGCHNGGDLIYCDECDLAVCYSLPEDVPRKGCMVIVSDEVEPLRFICPRCHVDTTRTQVGGFDQRGVPYHGFYTDDGPLIGFLLDVRHSMLEFFPRLNTSTTLLLQIALEGCEHTNEPFSDTYHQMFGYFGRDKGQLKAASITFDLAHDGGGYEALLSEAIRLISEPGVERVMIFFVAHNSTGGCIQYSPVVKDEKGVVLDPGASDEPKRVLDRVFPERLLSALKKITRTTLFFFVCQGADGHPQTRSWMLDTVKGGYIREILSFDAPSLQPDWARGFVSHYGRRFYLEGARFPQLLPDVLLASPRLGPSTDVFLFAVDPLDVTKILRRRYYWAQARCAPYGVRLPVRCPDCYCMQTLRISVAEQCPVKLLSTCKYRRAPGPDSALPIPCEHRILDNPPPNRSRGGEGRMGEWFFVEYVPAVEDVTA
ncbi:hypothetical protein ONZ45_g13444 [Pleurotus djamor]|nr:hypothetical protein ONZ45_g13444 [Pleurotus djamor]